MKAKSLNFIIPLVVYPFDCMCSLNEDADTFAKAVVKKWGSTILDDFKKSEQPNGVGLTYVYTSDSHLCCILKIDKFEKNAVNMGTLAHEAFHATEFVLRKCNLPLNENSHEAYAYLIGYLIQEIYKKL